MLRLIVVRLLALVASLARLIGLWPQRRVLGVQSAGATTLIADAANHRVIEVDGAGAILWQYGTTGVAGGEDNHLNTPQDAERLADGHTLIADAGNDRVIEVTSTGAIVWSYAAGQLLRPWSATRLADGQTLIVDRDNHRVIDVNQAGAVLWEYGTRGVPGNGPNQLRLPRAAERLVNGNTLIADHWNRVIEVTRERAIVWDYSLFAAVNAVSRLQSGNTLLAVDGGFLSFGVLEVSPSRTLEWAYLSAITADAKRLPNGNTLIAIPAKAHVVEVDRDGNIVWQYGTTDQPGAGPNHLSDPSEASRLTEARRGPDLAVRLIEPPSLPRREYIGVGVYGVDGANQSLGPIHLGGHDLFAFRLVNTGSAQEQFRVTATTFETPVHDRDSVGWDVRFHDAVEGGTEITAAVIGAGWVTPVLAPEEAVEFKAEVRSINRGSSEQLNLVVTSRSVADSSATDTVRTITQAKHVL